MCGDCCFAWSLLPQIRVPARHTFQQTYPPCSSSAPLPFLTCLTSFIHSLLLIIKIQQSSTISVPFCAELYSCVMLCCVYCVLRSLISFSHWHQPVHLPVCSFADILFINVSAERSTSGAAVSFQRYCRRSGVKICSVGGHLEQKH